MPRALLCKAFGGPDSLVFEEVDAPIAGSGQAVVSVKAAAVNFPDTLIIRGQYQFRPEPPFSPGAEIAGVIKELGAGVTGVHVGQRVMAQMPLPYGGFAEEVLLPASSLLPLAPPLSFESAAAFGATYGTSYHALQDRAQLRSGETLLVLGASGGIGLAAVELGTLMGARVVAAASSDDKLKVCAARGAAAVINYEVEDLRDAVRRLVGQEGVDVVCDPVGGKYTEQALQCMAWGGRYLVLGFASGDIPKVPLDLALLKGSSIVGVFWSAFIRNEPERSRREFDEIAALVAQGSLEPLVSKTYPMERGAQALSDMQARRSVGKLVLVT